MYTKGTVDARAIYTHKDAEVGRCPPRPSPLAIAALVITICLQKLLQALAQLGLISFRHDCVYTVRKTRFHIEKLLPSTRTLSTTN
jgi:hypothetical protein